MLPSGRVCLNFDQLFLACLGDWDDVVEALRLGRLARFFATIRRPDLEINATAVEDPDRRLHDLLELIPSDRLPPPRLEVLAEIVLPALRVGQDHSFDLRLANAGSRLLFGSVQTSCPWLWLGDSVTPSQAPQLQKRTFQFHTEWTLPVHVCGKALRACPTLKGRLHVACNGGEAAVEVCLPVPAMPFPHPGPLAGAANLGDFIDKVKADPHTAAPFFHDNSVCAWFQTNGWDYPITVLPADGVDVVRQFFIALNLDDPLTEPPPVAHPQPAADAVPWPPYSPWKTPLPAELIDVPLDSNVQVPFPPFEVDPFHPLRQLCLAAPRDWDAIIREAANPQLARRPLPPDLVPMVDEALAHALGSPDPSDRDIAGVWEMALAAGTARFDKTTRDRCDLAVRRRDCLATLDAIDTALPADEQDSLWQQHWAEILDGCSDADWYRQRHDLAVKRTEAWQAVERVLSTQDLARVQVVTADPLLADYPPAQRRKGDIDALVRTAAEVERVLGMLRSGGAVVVSPHDLDLIRNNPIQFQPFQNMLTRLLTEWLTKGVTLRAADPLSAPLPNGGGTTVRWTWPDLGRISYCRMATERDGFLQTPEQASRGTIRVYPPEHRLEGGGKSLLHSGSRRLYVTVWAVIDLGWLEVVGPPLHLGPISVGVRTAPAAGQRRPGAWW